MPTGMSLIVDDRAFIRFLTRAREGLNNFVDSVEEDLLEAATKESAHRGATWKALDPGDGVAADQFFAHFLARGTRPHGPIKAPRLVFTIDGQMISTMFVSGIQADPFDERARDATASRVDSIINRLMLGV